MTLQNKTTHIIIQTQSSKTLGILGIVFGLISIFTFALLFVPLALFCSILALFKKDSTSRMLGSFAILLSLIGIPTSPFILGIMGLSWLLR